MHACATAKLVSVGGWAVITNKFVRWEMNASHIAIIITNNRYKFMLARLNYRNGYATAVSIMNSETAVWRLKVEGRKQPSGSRRQRFKISP